ncbi:MAG: aldehyde ferredoxin oxidoreductase C-terminal domain-containing protein [Nitrososphaeria archaeon]
MHVLEGQVVRLDLSNDKVIYENFKQYYKIVLGGRGVNEYILLNENSVGTSCFDPSNLLAVGAGLLCGTGAPGASRISIDSRNPFTGGIGSANAGGDFGYAMRRSGLTNLLVKGKAEELSYIIIDDGCTRVVRSPELRLKTVSETNKIIKEREGEDFEVLCIGPAGENLVYSACVIVSENRSASRCGQGAVFGSKNLKAIAVRGTKTIDVEDPDDFDKAKESCLEALSMDEFNNRRMKYGVYCYTEPWSIESPYRNFSGEVPPEDLKKKLMPDEFYKYKVGSKTCKGCPIGCWAIHKVADNGCHLYVEALQGNTIHNFGAKLGISEPKDVLKAHYLCNEYGLDEDATSNVLAWAIDCYQKGIIDNKLTEGQKLEWGDVEWVNNMIEQIAYRKGFGGLLSQGCLSASRKIGRGSEALCVHVNGNDLFECLWTSVGWALGVTVSPRGGTHTRGGVIEERLKGTPAEILIKLFGIPAIEEPQSYVNKEKLVVYMERLNAALDCLGMCMFTHSSRFSMLLPDHYANLLATATGEEFTASDLLLVGEKVQTIERAYNILHIGWSRKNDIPPAVFFNRPLARKYNLDLQQYELLLDKYYEHHCWDKNGYPKKNTLKGLGLDFIDHKLEENGILLS